MREGLLVGLVTSVLAGGVIAQFVVGGRAPAESSACCGAAASADVWLDVNGDGRIDLVRRVPHATGEGALAEVWLAGALGFKSAWKGPLGPWCTQPSCRLVSLPMDVNGDGKMDLVLVTTNQDEVWADVWLSSGEGFDLKSTTRLDPSAPSEIETVRALDVNSDGKSDLVRSGEKDGVAWAQVWLSTGTEFEAGWGGAIGDGHRYCVRVVKPDPRVAPTPCQQPASAREPTPATSIQ